MLKTKGEQLPGKIGAPPYAGPSLPRTLFNRQWWWVTLVVLLGMGLLARLGFWQLDRLAQRRAYNAQTIQQLALPPLLLTAENLPGDLVGLKNRRVSAQGEFDFTHQVALAYQNWMDAPGIHLITPLVLKGGRQAVLVDRGWLPADRATPESWPQFDKLGPLSVTGFVQLSQTPRVSTGGPTQQTPAERQVEWYRVDIQAIQAQMPYELMPVYILEAPPEGGDTDLPYRLEPEIDVSDGPHLGYAIQWFIFALILGIIYARYVSKKENRQLPIAHHSQEAV